MIICYIGYLENLKEIRGAFNKFPDFFFIQAFRIVVDS